MNKITQRLRDWALVWTMLAGVGAYMAYAAVGPSPEVRALAGRTVAIVQPALIFLMLFLTFCRIDPRNLRLCRWHGWLLAVQCGLFVGLGVWIIAGQEIALSGMAKCVIEGAMICLICPTATAAPVITGKLGGDIAHTATYTLLINLAAAVLIPLMVPWLHPQAGISVGVATLMILGKVFPLLLLPFVCAELLRRFWPEACRVLASKPDAPFYLWVVGLGLAMVVTARSIAHSTVPIGVELLLGAVALVCCVFQFWAGRKIGGSYGDAVSAGQALGQKNTIFAIWLGWAMFEPVTSVAGGFYSVWHNVVNSWQLYKKRKADEQKVQTER